MKLFEPPPETQWNVLSLGAGVQSSCLALMAAKGEITPMPDFAVFADTQAEPESVYSYLDWLETQLPFPVYRVTKGSLWDDELKTHSRKDGTTYLKINIPVFGIKKNGEKSAAIGRRCTSDYKVQPILNLMKGKCGIARGQKEITVTQWVGISWDELQRIKEQKNPWIQSRWPLIENRMTRQQCLQWMSSNNYPEPPRSACTFCPFHSDTEWRRLRDHEPHEFQKALVFDAALRHEVKRSHTNFKMEVYLHSSCKPLNEIDFDNDEDKGQQVWDFQAECEGMCGV